jgi:hypothetical protein
MACRPNPTLSARDDPIRWFRSDSPDLKTSAVFERRAEGPVESTGRRPELTDPDRRNPPVRARVACLLGREGARRLQTQSF